MTSFSWIPFENLTDIKDVVYDIMSDRQAAVFMGEERIAAIADSLEQRIRKLKKIASGAVDKTGNRNVPVSTQDDVEKNIAEDYTNKKNLRYE